MSRIFEREESALSVRRSEIRDVEERIVAVCCACGGAERNIMLGSLDRDYRKIIGSALCETYRREQ